ncbi:2247_t:CDS:2, partial [Cetraspora pellucida]
SRGNKETAGRVKYRLEFEEYPETASDGVACIYNVAGMDLKKANEIFDLKNIQYSYKDGTSHNEVYCSFLNTKVYKETRSCCGVKFSNELLVDNATLNEFVAAHKIACKYYDELTQIRCNGKPILTKFYQCEDDTSPSHYFIGCQNYKRDEKGHRFLSLSQRTNIDYLKQLFQNYLYHDDINNKI